MTISNEVLRSEWLDRIDQALKNAEKAEKELSYVSVCGSERARKLSGSYYTPIDVARFFWNEFFQHSRLTGTSQAAKFVNQHKFIEPSVGAGALFFALLERLVVAGLSPVQLSQIDAELVDINQHALMFIRKNVGELERKLGVTFSNLRYSCVDFREANFSREEKPIVFFGNPPFVKNTNGAPTWKNLFADFLDKCVRDVGEKGSVHLVLPISIAFSRDYRALRRSLKARPRMIALSHFDNIPDTLFKSGKPLHNNSNKANSQRCSILTLLPSDKQIVLSTKLHRWSKRDRHKILGQSPEYLNVTDYGFDDQFPRPSNQQILRYLTGIEKTVSFRDLVQKPGKYKLYVAGVARNYIGIREHVGRGVHEFRFNRQVDFFSALYLITSDLFQDYWLTIGDGFHVTKSNILDFPLSEDLLERLHRDHRKIKRIWDKREKFSKFKLNSGIPTASYDFSGVVPSLYLG